MMMNRRNKMSVDHPNVHPIHYWRENDHCAFYLREMRVTEENIKKLHAGGIAKMRDLCRIDSRDSSVLVSLGIVDVFEQNNILAARSFWINRPPLCLIL